MTRGNGEYYGGSLKRRRRNARIVALLVAVSGVIALVAILAGALAHFG